MHTGEPMCKMQSLQLNNLKHNRNENPIPFRMPCRNCRRRHKPTTNVAFVRSQLCMRRRGRQRPSSAFHPDSRICGNVISTRDVNCIRAILGSTNAQNMARDMLEIAQNAINSALPTFWTFMMPWGEDPGWELHSDRQRRGTNLPFGVKAVTATAAARQAAARA